MISIISIYSGGILTLLMAIFHIRFPKLFKWEADIRRVSEINKKIFFTIHLALLLIFFIIGLLSLFFAQELSECKGISLGLNVAFSAFWFWRAVWQIYYFKGKVMHYVLTAIFFLLCIAYAIPVVLN